MPQAVKRRRKSLRRRGTVTHAVCMKRIPSLCIALAIASSSILALAPASSAASSVQGTVHLQRPAPGSQMGTQGFSSEFKAWMCRTFGSMCG